MSRMMIGACLVMFSLGATHANDVDKYPPGHKPFNAPKAPLPNGVFAPDSCFGYHATRWTPWCTACTNCGATESITQSCTNKAIILFETPSTSKAMPAPAKTVPAPETIKPMPPVQK